MCIYVCVIVGGGCSVENTCVYKKEKVEREQSNREGTEGESGSWQLTEREGESSSKSVSICRLLDLR